MEQSPLPPHERSWRHPSELAAEERSLARSEPLPASSRVFAFTTGTAGLIAIAALFVMVTPSRDAQPVAVSASTSPIAVAEPGDTAGSIISARRSSPDNRLPEVIASTAALATPIGAGQYALVLRASLPTGAEGAVEVMLPSGRITSGEVVDDSPAGDAVLVHLHDHEPGHEVAERRPHERDVVTVMASPPIEVALADLDRVEVADGTAVVDAEGHLVGLCSERRGGGVRLVEVSTDVTDAAQP